MCNSSMKFVPSLPLSTVEGENCRAGQAPGMGWPQESGPGETAISDLRAQPQAPHRQPARGGESHVLPSLPSCDREENSFCAAG